MHFNLLTKCMMETPTAGCFSLQSTTDPSESMYDVPRVLQGVGPISGAG